jgi:hypothetical protein
MNIIHVEREEETFCKREISATFENGGGIQITVRGDSVGGVLEILLKILAVVELNPDRMMDLTLNYRHLTEDLDRVDVTASDFSNEGDLATAQQIVRRLAANAKSKLLRNLAQHHITLRGEKGEL